MPPSPELRGDARDACFDEVADDKSDPTDRWSEFNELFERRIIPVHSCCAPIIVPESVMVPTARKIDCERAFQVKQM